jgi:hypothetical protein
VDPNKRKAKRLLTDALNVLANSIESLDSGDNPVTKAQKLAEIVWNHAIGSEMFNAKTGKRTQLKPQQWAIQLLFERLEGRVPVILDDVDGFGPGVADRVSELAEKKINDIADKHKEDK